MIRIYRHLFMAAIGVCFVLTAQASSHQRPEERGLSTIDRPSAEAFVGFLASDELEGREAGQHGGQVAARYIASLLQQWNLKPLLGDSYFQPFEAYAPDRQLRKHPEVHPDSIAKLKQGVHQTYRMRNVLACIEGKRRDEVVIVGAHYDHVGTDPMLEGDRIYNGADDNASGVSAVLQIARAFAATGEKPERTVIFAFWDGEEKGLLGSRYFAQTYPDIKHVKGYLNFDMIGRNHDESKPRHVVYFYTESVPAFGAWLKDDIRTHKLPLEPDYRAWDNPVGGSDNGTFAKLGIPIMWYHTDGHPDYHKPSDEASRINWTKLVAITRASFLGMWRMANQAF